MGTRQKEKIEQLFKETADKKAEIEKTVFYDDFIEAFQSLMKYVDKVRKDLTAQADKQGSEITDQLAKAVEQINSLSADLEKKHASMMATMQSDQRTFQRMLSDQVNSLWDDIPDAYDDEEMCAQLAALQAAFDALEIPDKFDATELTAQVEKNTKDIEELQKRPATTGSGGARVTDKAVQSALMRSVKSETPSGAVDGVNDTYYVSSTIHAVLGFELGSRVVSLGSYSITGGYRKTIVFDNPIPANYSDDSFVIIYI